MLIGIDGNEANVKERVGISEYAFELLWQFYKIQNPKFKIYLKEKPSSDLPKESENWQYRIVGPKRLWTQLALPLALFKDCRLRGRCIDVFFTPNHYAPRWSPVPTVISIMDLSYVHFPQMFKKSGLYQLQNWTAYSVKNAKKILTISQASKNDIIEYYKVEESKVVVTYPGIKMKIRNPRQRRGSPKAAKSEIPARRCFASSDAGGRNKLKKKYGINGEYILFVGTLQPRKNLVRLIEAFSTLNPNPYTLIIVGKKGWLYEEILEAPEKFGIEDRVKFLDFVPDDDLQVLYKNAICFVLPSLYEGFGLPVLEAMNNGCPVITSNVSSLPEAAGDAALYVNPEDIDDIKEKLELIIQNSELRKELIEKGYKQVRKFSWEKTARETLRVLKEVIKENRQA